MITFTKIDLPYGWLGNMSRHSILYGEETWRSSEALFQSLRFNDFEIKRQINQEKSPFRAKLIAKKNREKMVVEPKSIQDLKNMYLCLKLKIEQHPQLKEELISTSDEKIIEDVTKRPSGNNLFWGMALINDVWVGENNLGNLWMKLRSELL